MPDKIKFTGGPNPLHSREHGDDLTAEPELYTKQPGVKALLQASDEGDTSDRVIGSGTTVRNQSSDHQNKY